MLHMDSLPLKCNQVKSVALRKETEERTVAPEGIVMLTLFKFVSCMLTHQRTLFRLVTRPLSGSLCCSCVCHLVFSCFCCWISITLTSAGRKLGDRFREHLLDIKNKGSDLSKPVAGHFILPGHSHGHMEICGINLHLGNNETRKRKEQRLIFKLRTLAPNGINERFSFA